MLQEIRNPFGIFDIGLAARHGFDVLRIDQQELELLFQEVPNRSPIHASPNVTKGVLDWEYTREILQSDLRTYLTDPLQTASARLVPSREGACSQGPGAPHGQDVPSQPQASGGDGHV